MTDYEIDPKLFHEVANQLEASADYQSKPDATLVTLICANIVRGFLRLSKARQVEINLLGSGLPAALAAELSDDYEQVETLKELSVRSVNRN